MKTKEKIILILCFLVIGISIGVYFGTQYFLNRDLEKAKEELQETIDHYGLVEKETVTDLIAQFNTEIEEAGILFKAIEFSREQEDKTYWYRMSGNLYCYVVVSNFTGNPEKDIVSMMAIHYPKEGGDELALLYTKRLLKANQIELTDEEIDELLQKAASSSNSKNIQSGKGIAVSFKEAEDHYEYQVIRIYD